MISYFPNPYPDEPLYSVCARLYQRTEASSKREFAQMLFGSSAAVAVLDLPCHLGHLSSILPFGHSRPVDAIINMNTFLPYYRPFLSEQQYMDTYHNMIAGDGKSVHVRAGINANSVKQNIFLKYCPQCVQNDRERFGECYWHRVHQLPGVSVCPEHNVELHDSSVNIKTRTTRYKYVSAEQAINNLNRTGDIIAAKEPRLLRITQDTFWLLNTTTVQSCPEDIRLRYLNELANLELATYSGQIRVQKLIPKFVNFFGAEFLQQLGCPLDLEMEHSWLLRMLRSKTSAIAPICHILLMQFLGYSAEEFFALPVTIDKPFGDAPWPCLNPTCAYYRLNTIDTCEIKYSLDGDGKPTGYFTCECGFSYARKGPDTEIQDAYRIGRMVDFGPVWKDQLKKLWNDPSVSLREASRQLRVDPATVKKHAAKLGLSKHTVSRQMNASSDSTQDSGYCYYDRWLELRRLYPDASTTELRSKDSKVYAWLYRNDREWLNQNKPPRIASNAGMTRVDWTKRDTEFEKRVEDATLRLKNRSGRPTQLTITAICREAGIQSIFEKHSDKLPETKNMVVRLSEDRVEFAVRRIYWAANQYKSDKTTPKRWELIKFSGVERLKNEPYIIQVIDKVMKMLC